MQSMSSGEQQMPSITTSEALLPTWWASPDFGIGGNSLSFLKLSFNFIDSTPRSIYLGWTHGRTIHLCSTGISQSIAQSWGLLQNLWKSAGLTSAGFLASTQVCPCDWQCYSNSSNQFYHQVPRMPDGLFCKVKWNSGKCWNSVSEAKLQFLRKLKTGCIQKLWGQITFSSHLAVICILCWNLKTRSEHALKKGPHSFFQMHFLIY